MIYWSCYLELLAECYGDRGVWISPLIQPSHFKCALRPPTLVSYLSALPPIMMKYFKRHIKILLSSLYLLQLAYYSN